MGLRLHNTLTKRVEELVTREAGKAAIYVCGPTVYDVTHLGHMRAAVVFDVLRRYLEFRGYQVMHVQNVTDVEDKIIARAQAEGVPTDAITARYLEDYRQASRALNVMPPHVEPRASQHIPEMIEMIKKLVEGGYAYSAEGDVYFDVSRLPQYGKLSGQLPAELRAGARVEPGEHKRHPADFALWKRAKPGEPSWDGPWGRGRPGWHIECSAMSLKYLGMGFDIHGGGDDLIFPHHENEIAQSEAYAATQPFARYWVHNAMVMVRGEKMSKSLHNYIAVADALGRFPADVIRYALAAVHYRKPIEVDEARLQDAAKAVDRLRIALASAETILARAGGRGTDGPASRLLRKAAESARTAFTAAMDDDLNTSSGLAAVFELAAEMNRVTDQVLKGGTDATETTPGLREAREALRTITAILGLRLESAGDEDLAGRVRDLAVSLRQEAAHLFSEPPGQTLDKIVTFILAGREQARATRDFVTADRIRTRMAEAGILVEDLPTGPKWRIASTDGRRPTADASGPRA